MDIVTVQVQGKGGAITRIFKWRKGLQGQEGEIALPSDQSVSISAQLACGCSFKCEGDLELVSSSAGLTYRWSDKAKKKGEGSGTILVASQNEPDDPLTFEVEMEDESKVKVDKDDSKVEANILTATPNTGFPVVDQYGAYAIGLLGALGALGFAWLVPGWSHWLVGGAVSIGIFTFWMTEEYDAFVVRILAFLGAAALMFLGMAMPENANTLTGLAGTACTVAVLCGDGDFDDFWFW